MGRFDDYIFLTPSFLRGAGHALDISGALSKLAFVRHPTSEEADRRALASDWRVVGRDLHQALSRVASSVPSAE